MSLNFLEMDKTKTKYTIAQEESRTTANTLESSSSSEDGPIEPETKTRSLGEPQYSCNACKQAITGTVIKALDKSWHPEHFVCHHCRKPISELKFNVEKGKPYCEDDYVQMFLKKCHSCKLPIRNVSLLALGSYWHRDHFVCTACGAKIGNKGYFERDNNAFCQECFRNNFSPTCKSCSNPITDGAVEAVGEKYHQKCFICVICRTLLVGAKFEIINGKPVCESCSISISGVLTSENIQISEQNIQNMR